MYAGAVAQAARNGERVGDFLRAHKTDGVGEGLGLAKLEELLQRAQVLAAQQDVLVSLGMSPQVVDDLGKSLGEFERTLEATREGRREHVGASADLEAIGAEVAEQVKLLDGVVQYRFGDDAELMGAWASARNVLGPFKPKEQAAGEGGSQTPRAV